MIQQELAPSRSWFMIAALAVLLIAGGFSLYFEFEEASVKNELDELKVKKESLEKPTEELKNDETVLRASALAVKERLQKIETEQFLWSKIIEKIEAAVPAEKETNAPIIRLRSYTGSPEGKVAVAAMTNPGAADPFNDIASAIRAFSAEPSFKEVFVPSVTKSLTPEGEIVLSFSMNFSYQKQNF